MGSYEEECLQRGIEPKLAGLQLAHTKAKLENLANNANNAKPAREARPLGEQLNFDLVSVATLEAEIRKLRCDAIKARRTIKNYEANREKTDKVMKEYKILLNDIARLLMPRKGQLPKYSEQLKDYICNQLLSKGLINGG